MVLSWNGGPIKWLSARVPTLPPHLTQLVSDLGPDFTGEVTIAGVHQQIYPTSTSNAYAPGAELAVLRMPSVSADVRIARRSQDMEILSNAFQRQGVDLRPVATLAGVKVTAVDANGMRWTKEDQLMSPRGGSSSINADNAFAWLSSFAGVQGTAAVPELWQTRRDEKLEPIGFTAHFMFNNNKNMLIVRVGASIQAMARYCTDFAKNVTMRDRGVKPNVVAAALSNVEGWAFCGSTADMLNGVKDAMRPLGDKGIAKTLHLAVDLNHWDQTLDALRTVVKPGAETEVNLTTGTTTLKTTAGLVELTGVAHEVFSRLPITRSGAQQIPIGPGLAANQAVANTEVSRSDFGLAG